MLLNSSACSGASSFAWLRTSVKLTDPVLAMVVVRPPSNAQGTSTPCTLRPSERMYCTWYCVSVIALLVVGEFGDPDGPGSFSASWNDTCPRSANVDDTPSTTVRTSENSTEPKVPALAPPRDACRFV